MPHTQQVFLAWHRMSFVFKATSRQSLPSVHSLSWCDALAASPMLILQLGLVWKRWEMSKSPCQQTPVSLFSLGWSKSVHFFVAGNENWVIWLYTALTHLGAEVSLNWSTVHPFGTPWQPTRTEALTVQTLSSALRGSLDCVNSPEALSWRLAILVCWAGGP